MLGMLTTTLRYLTYLVPLLAIGVQLLLSPRIKPFWMSLKQPWPSLIGAAMSVVGTTLTAHASGDDWNTSVTKGILGLTTTGLVGHTLEVPPRAEAKAVSSSVEKTTVSVEKTTVSADPSN